MQFLDYEIMIILREKLLFDRRFKKTIFFGHFEKENHFSFFGKFYILILCKSVFAIISQNVIIISS